MAWFKQGKFCGGLKGGDAGLVQHVAFDGIEWLVTTGTLAGCFTVRRFIKSARSAGTELSATRTTPNRAGSMGTATSISKPAGF